jgi:hypothetical protein
MTRDGTGRAKARTVTAIGIGCIVLLGSFFFFNWVLWPDSPLGVRVFFGFLSILCSAAGWSLTHAISLTLFQERTELFEHLRVRGPR